MFEGHNRDELRQAYARAWQKHLARLPLTPLESLITDVIVAHPEYQILVADTQSVRAFEANAEGSAENPFLHMGLHLAVNEQLSIDRPPGIRTLYQHLQAVCEDAHGAEHVLMECLAETLWLAQRSGQAPDEKHYMARARERLGPRQDGRKG